MSKGENFGDAYGKGDAGGELCRRKRKMSRQTKCEGQGRREDMRVRSNSACKGTETGNRGGVGSCKFC